jgi:hypothetical protein
MKKKTTTKIIRSKKKTIINRERVAVTQYTIKGRKVKKFNSMTEASNSTGVNTGSISKASRGICKTAGGFRWELA